MCRSFYFPSSGTRLHLESLRRTKPPQVRNAIWQLSRHDHTHSKFQSSASLTRCCSSRIEECQTYQHPQQTLLRRSTRASRITRLWELWICVWCLSKHQCDIANTQESTLVTRYFRFGKWKRFHIPQCLIWNVDYWQPLLMLLTRLQMGYQEMALKLLSSLLQLHICWFRTCTGRSSGRTYWPSYLRRHPTTWIYACWLWITLAYSLRRSNLRCTLLSILPTTLISSQALIVSMSHNQSRSMPEGYEHVRSVKVRTTYILLKLFFISRFTEVILIDERL